MRVAAVGLALAAGLAAAPGPATGGMPAMAEAEAMLARAADRLARADGREARIAALARAVQAHERALALLRAGLRRLAAEDARLAAALAADHDRLERLLGALQSLARAPRTALLAFPGGPVRAARAAGLMGAVVPGLEREAAALSDRLEALRSVRLTQERVRAQTTETLAGLQRLRAAARGAARGRTEAPDAAEMTRAAEAARDRAADLAGLADALGPRIAGRPGTASFASRRASLLPPVAGRITAGVGGVDPWGRTGRGVTFTAPGPAMVVAPADATIRYAGTLTGFGHVVILEPAEGWLLVLAGLDTVTGTVGETIQAGARIGTLGQVSDRLAEFSLDAGAARGQTRERDLYVELRRDGAAIDPAPWFAPGQE